MCSEEVSPPQHALTAKAEHGQRSLKPRSLKKKTPIETGYGLHGPSIGYRADFLAFLSIAGRCLERFIFKAELDFAFLGCGGVASIRLTAASWAGLSISGDGFAMAEKKLKQKDGRAALATLLGGQPRLG
jgi:hypothetical protein